MSAMRSVRVEAPGREYDVLIGDGALTAGAGRLAALCPRGRAVVAADETALRVHGQTLTEALQGAGVEADVVSIPGGEAAKSWTGLEQLCDALLDFGLERADPVIAFGGGTIGDLAGFAAAIVKRGAGSVQIPTTLLAQVDSSVGGKTGINTRQGKNLIGAFHQPRLVIADTALLASLPERELKAGYAEIVKAALIGDAALFDRLDAFGADALAPGALAAFIAEAVAFKARIVAEDETEKGVRALLNLGHTFAHAFEAEAAGGTLIHGEAVAAGLGLAFAYSERIGACDSGAAARVRAHLDAVGLPSTPAALPGGPYEAERLVERMAHDKKNQAGEITLILARAPGEAYIAPGADRADLVEFLKAELS